MHTQVTALWLQQEQGAQAVVQDSPGLWGLLLKFFLVGGHCLNTVCPSCLCSMSGRSAVQSLGALCPHRTGVGSASRWGIHLRSGGWETPAAPAVTTGAVCVVHISLVHLSLPVCVLTRHVSCFSYLYKNEIQAIDRQAFKGLSSLEQL